MPFPRLPLAAALLTALTVAGCDNAQPVAVTGPDPASATADEDAAVSIANALALDGGGALGALTAAAEAADPSAGRSGDPGCTGERTFDEATTTWTGFVSCERGRPDGPFYALYSRTRTYQFLDGGGTPQPSPDGAQTLNFAVIDGEGLRRRPGFEHTLLGIGADLVVDDLQAERVTVNGTYDRSATDSLRTRNALRTLTYDLAMTLIDVQAPRRAHGPRGLSGTIEGTYDAVRTFTTRNGTREQEIHRDFVITFGERDGGREVARIRLDDRTFEADLATGEILG